MNLLDSFGTGFRRSQKEIREIEFRVAEINSFFSEFVANFPKESLLQHELAMKQFEFGITLVSDKNCEDVALVEYNFGDADCYYSDFRNGPKYPLPLNSKSYEVLATYFGVSVAWYLEGKSTAHLSKLLNGNYGKSSS